MFFRRKQPSTSTSSSYIGFVVLCIVIATVGLRLYEWIATKPDRPMLTQVEQMVQLTKLEDVASYVKTIISTPSKLFESNLYIIGVYPKAGSTFSAESVGLVFVRDHTRFVEIDYLPKVTRTEHLTYFSSKPQEQIVIDEQTTGTLIRLRASFDCIDPKPKAQPSFCQFTRLLLFEKNGVLIKLAADGNRITDGELLEMARSIK
jgi:hypothetical protein